MRKFMTGITALVISLMSVSAQAEITRLGIRFAAGCTSSNSQGSCTIDTVAFGSFFTTPRGVRLYRSDSRTGKFRPISAYTRKLDVNGRARSRFKNIPGACFQMRMGAEKQKLCDLPQVNTTRHAGVPTPIVEPAVCSAQKAIFSNVLCEGDANPSNGKSSSAQANRVLPRDAKLLHALATH